MASVATGRRSLALPTWRIDLEDEPERASVNAARLAVTDGTLGSRTFSEIGSDPEQHAAVMVAGVYGPEPQGELLAAPAWTPTGWRGEGLGWSLDLTTGTVSHRLRLDGGEVWTRRFAVAGCPGAQAFVAPTVERLSDLPAPVAHPTVLRGGDGRVAVIAVARRATSKTVTTVAVVRSGWSEREVDAMARSEAERLAEVGSAELVARQQRRWTRRWSDFHVSIDGDPTAELRTRFALYQLLSLRDCGEELGLGARGLTGPAYKGHVFWDSDVFVLPALVTVASTPARAMVEYRLRRVDAARRSARAEGLAGARFPWESAATGCDVTPRRAVTPTGEIPIRTGEQELHITADVCWAMGEYVRWSGDTDVYHRGGAELVVEAARYWASRTAADGNGPGHLSGVIGPDEYHEAVDDNAFTNNMVTWNLQQAERMVSEGLAEASPSECRGWAQAASVLDDGYDTAAGRHIQFRGYDELETIVADSIAPPPFPADLLLGRAGVQRSQLIKQADVVMLHHMLPDRMPPGSLDRDLDHYLPRTAHGSSLSPAIHAAVLARAGRPDEALRWYRLALGIDLDDLTGTGSGGLHYANLGGVWQALIGGFLGLRPTHHGLVVDPRLPSSWKRVELGFELAGVAVKIRVDHRRAELAASSPIAVAARDGARVAPASDVTLLHDGHGWVPA